MSWTWYIVVPVWACAATVSVISFRKIQRIRQRQRQILAESAERRDFELRQTIMREQARNMTEAGRIHFRAQGDYMPDYRVQGDYSYMTDYSTERVSNYSSYIQRATEARERARERLLASMTEKQRQDYTLLGYFDVVGSNGTLYRLRNEGHVGNIVQPTVNYNLRPSAAPQFKGPHFCMHLYNGRDSFPEEDHLLAQALLIRTDEAAFLKTACHLS